MSTVSGISGMTGSQFGGPAAEDIDNITPRELRDMWKVPTGIAAKKMFADLDKNDHLDQNGDYAFETIVRKEGETEIYETLDDEEEIAENEKREKQIMEKRLRADREFMAGVETDEVNTKDAYQFFRLLEEEVATKGELGRDHFLK